MRVATSIELFTTEKDFNEFLDVGSTPELEQLKQHLQVKISTFPGNVRSTLKDLMQTRLAAIRKELAVR